MSEDSAETNSGRNDSADRIPMKVRIAMRSDVGRVRSENQDFAIVSDEIEGGAEKGQLMVVADGMGGHKGGATASKLAANTIKERFLSSGGDDVAAILRDAMEQANAVIFQEASEHDELEGMGTTTSALLIRGGRCWIGHVGDSRIYRVRGGEIEQLTDDHSLVATMVREGLLSAEEAETHPRRNVLQRSMGVASEVEADVAGPLDLAPGDHFLLCSDGLHGLVNSSEMAEVINNHDIEAAADRFIELALERGAHDNVTVIVAAADGGAPRSMTRRPMPAGSSEPLGDTTEPRLKPSADRSMGAGGCLLRTMVIGLSLLAIVASFFLLVAGDVFVSWFYNGS